MQFTTALLELLYTELRRITIKHRKRYLDVLARVHSAVVCTHDTMSSSSPG